MYNNGGMESQIDLLACRRGHLKELINGKGINGDAVSAHHRVLVIDREIQRGKNRKPEQASNTKIKVLRLKEDSLKVQLRGTVLDEVRPLQNVRIGCRRRA